MWQGKTLKRLSHFPHVFMMFHIFLVSSPPRMPGCNQDYSIFRIGNPRLNLHLWLESWLGAGVFIEHISHLQKCCFASTELLVVVLKKNKLFGKLVPKTPPPKGFKVGAAVKLLTRKLTWQSKITIFSRRYIFRLTVSHCHVSFPGCTMNSNSI